MVAISDIRLHNASVAAEGRHGIVCVFAGATAGIGAATLRELVGSLQSSTFYILGRNPSRFSNTLDELLNVNPTNTIVFIETQVSLISSVDKACAQIAASESKIDIICLSPGGMPFHGAVCKTSPALHISCI